MDEMADSSESTILEAAASIPQLEAVKTLLTTSYLECSERGLLQTAEWLKSLSCIAIVADLVIVVWCSMIAS